ncbi:MAG: S9 family peptidase [Alphaproteobacteria bacterium]|nr:S9 family peptidase [Alphaproteobacteria bacterium]
MRNTILILILIFSAFMPCEAQKELKNKKVWTPELSISYKDIFSVTVSPNGEKTLIIYNDKDKKMKGCIRFCVVSNKDKKTLFVSPKNVEHANARWSPNGKWISYMKTQGNNYFIEITDAEKYTPITVYTIPSNLVIEFPQWSPNSKNIAFVSTTIKKDEVPSAYKFAGVNVVVEDKHSREPSRLAILSLDLENKIFSGLSFLTPGTFQITNDRIYRADHSPYSWSPDSSSLAFSFVTTKEDDFYPDTQVAIVNINTGRIEELDTEGPALNPFFSLDGKNLAFVVGVKPPPHSPFKKADTMFTSLRVCLLDLEKGTQRFLANTPNENPQIIGWVADSSSVIVTDNEHTKVALYSLSAKGEDLIRLPLETMSSFSHLNSTGTYIGFVGESFSLPPEAYISSLKEFKPMKLTQFHQDLYDLPKFKSEIITWSSFDGKTIEGILTYPAEYKQGVPVPLIVLAHGGPALVWQETYLGFAWGNPPAIALYAAHGFAVLRPNIRGSDGYGVGFREAMYKDWSNGPYNDVMTGVDLLIKQGIADPQKLVIGGHSYGGYLTAWAITQTDRFKTALIFAGISNLISDGSTNASAYFGGGVWVDEQTWLKSSPIMYAEKIKTSTLIQQGLKDQNVNIDQSSELYNVLKIRKIPVKMIVYKNQEHDLKDQAAIISTKATFEWLDQYVGGF